MPRPAAPRVNVSTSTYQFRYGRRPHGYGSWAFAFDGADALEALFWVNQSTFADARKAAVAEARKRGASSVEVQT